MRDHDYKLLGRWGEALAAEYLRQHGFALLAINWRCRMGEIDLVAMNKTHLHFVEVKLRKDDRFAKAREFVDFKKQEKLRTTAKMYLAQHNTEMPACFDVVEIYAPQGIATKEPKIFYIENAFE